MNSFRTVEDLRRSLFAAGIGAEAAAIAATARPAILFTRLQADDDGLAVGTSKLGGFPDLPDGFDWPTRPPFPDAERRAAELRRAGEGTRSIVEQMMRDSPSPGASAFTQAQADQLAANREAQIAVQFEPFSLAFVAQLDLEALSKQEGFDPVFPSSGVLSVFVDVTNQDWSRAHRVVWRDTPVSALKRTPPPAELVAYHDAHGSFGGPLLTDQIWAAQTKAETLIPSSAVTVPHHWLSHHLRGGPAGRRIHDWFHSDAHKFYPEAPTAADGAKSGNFGDRLGGWPPIVQGDVEDDIDGGSVGATPGQTPWRQIFTYGGEFFAGTRSMLYEGVGDGAVYLMIRTEDLAARRFERMIDIVQRT